MSGMPAIAMMSPGPRGLGVDAVERFGHVELGDLRLLDRRRRCRHHATCWPRSHDAVAHPTEREPADVRRRVEVGDHRLERMTLLVLRRRDVLEDQLAQRLEVAALDIGVRATPNRRARSRRRSGTRSGARSAPRSMKSSYVSSTTSAMRASGRSTLLTTRITGRCASSALRKHEPRLRQRPFARVDEQQHAVDHREAALDLAAEVGVAGRVDDVQRHVAVPHRGVLGEDRDALLALEVVRVHDALGDVLVGAEGARLPQQARRRAWSCRGRRARRSRCCAGRRVQASAAGYCRSSSDPASARRTAAAICVDDGRRDRRLVRAAARSRATSRYSGARCRVLRLEERARVVADVGPVPGVGEPAGERVGIGDRATRRSRARNRARIAASATTDAGALITSGSSPSSDRGERLRFGAVQGVHALRRRRGRGPSGPVRRSSSESLSTVGPAEPARARGTPTVVFPAPISPTSTT